MSKKDALLNSIQVAREAALKSVMFNGELIDASQISAEDVEQWKSLPPFADCIANLQIGEFSVFVNNTDVIHFANQLTQYQAQIDNLTNEFTTLVNDGKLSEPVQEFISFNEFFADIDEDFSTSAPDDEEFNSEK